MNKTENTQENKEALKNEVWKPVQGYESYYLVSNEGRVKTIEGRLLKQYKGYRFSYSYGWVKIDGECH